MPSTRLPPSRPKRSASPWRRLGAGIPVWAIAGVLAAGSARVLAQAEASTAGGEGGPLFRWTPGIAIAETMTDNLRLTTTDREAEAITELSASLTLERLGGRVQGFLDYSLTGTLHARGRGSDGVRNDLNAAGRAELVDEFAFLDAAAAISRQSISAFGPQSFDDTLDNPNRTEVRRYSLAPYLRGRLGSRASWTTRLSYAATDSSDEAGADVRDMQALVEAGSDRTERLGWGLRGSRDITDFRFGRRIETDSVTGTLRAAPGAHLLLSATAGREATDALSPEKRSYRRHGLGLDWRPTERTRFAAEREQRYFGKSHAVVLSHQMARSVWTYSDVRGVTSDPARDPGFRGTVFDLFFRQFALVEPDPARRTLLVNSYLQANGLNPDLPVLGGFLSQVQMVERRQSLSAAFSGARSVVVVSVQQSRTHPLEASAGGQGGVSETDAIRQRGAALTLARRLTPSANLSLGFAQQQNRGEPDEHSNRLRTYTVSWSERLGPRSSVSVGARHARFESREGPYRENAVVARLSVEF